MPAEDLTFRALWRTEASGNPSVFKDDFEAVAFDVFDISSETFRIEGGSWSMDCKLSTFDMITGYVVAYVSKSDDGGYLLCVDPVSSEIDGDITVNVPCPVNFSGDITMRITDPSGTRFEEVSSDMLGGRTYVSVRVPAGSLCHLECLNEVTEHPKQDFTLLFGTMMAAILGIVLWRHLRM
jgi:hypothetical protein